MSESPSSTPPNPSTPADGGIVFRPMTALDLPGCQALSEDLRWPHRPADWEQVFAHAEGVVAEQDGRIIATAQRWCWGDRHATIGLVIVSPASQGHGLGRRLMNTMLEGLDGRSVLLQATAEGRGLYERLGFVQTGELRQHQGMAKPTALIGLPPGWRLRPAGANEAAALKRLDTAARGMPRDALIEDLLAIADSCVVLVDHDSAPRGFAMLRRFGRGHIIGPVVAPDAESAKVLIAHLAGQNAGRFTRIDIDFASGLSDWLEGIGLPSVDAPTTMLRGAPLADGPGAPNGPRLFAITTQALC
ncbi:GNAT family N-acetyltransferase [Rhodoferax koreense]|uniref:GNAT family N-acetyltransferase n=1 Tax=Rhodoferax koreensis TaxID=1842727 RepID=A0A1P8K1T4_9BURK|nr:GNAT family N-acetyltransferase [Rhodoferax koreense]APW39957.1 GNAT family N-acetyltransferase [Rhodoferax koreense]